MSNVHLKTGTGRIIKSKLSNGEYSYSFTIVKHIRINGKPTHITFANIGTWTLSKLNSEASKFWGMVDHAIGELRFKGILSERDAELIESKFSTLVTRPTNP